ncbi:mRNA interferase YafQ [hydrothermal vent metagenome]|uniref:mRNA interferase YafQ n=2 Tax=hydrothermal vent metagenome TaxID=652676 RepID=A0A3B0VPD7_9ZZZZ
MALFKHVNELLVAGEQLPVKNRDHILTGNWKGHRECHIEPDWLLIYRVNEVEKEIEYVRMGSHSDLF